MSYILEALKKSDRKRQQGQVPTLQTTQVDPAAEPKKKPLWPYLLLAVLALNAVLLAVVFHPWRSGEAVQATRPTPADNKPATVPAKSPEGVPAQASQAATASRQPERTMSPVVKSVKNKPAHGAANPTAPPPQTGAAGPVQVAAIAPEDLHGESALARRLSPGGSPASEREAARALSPDPDPLFEAASIGTGSKQKMIPMQQLPPNLLQEIPDIHVSAHIYSSKPSSRLVSVNGRILRQGQTMPPGLKLVEITEEGVIFTYEGYRFYVAVL